MKIKVRDMSKVLLRVGFLILLVVGIETGYYEYAVKNLSSMESYIDFFDDNVHQVDINISQENWKSILDNPLEEEYHSCNITIDGERFSNVGIRTKGNSSLSNIADSGKSDRYSFKINFGKYDKGQTFYGLDEVCFNNLYADATYMKEFLSYDMFEYMGVPAPLCTFVNISINGQPWGLYVAVESIDESFLKRNFGEDYGELYKPESEFLKSDFPTSNPRIFKGEDLIYIDDNFDSYTSIFDNLKTDDLLDEDKIRLINSLKKLNNGELDSIMDKIMVLKFWVAQNFMCSYDTYIGRTLHNYYLYEKNGYLVMLPWDYNLSFGGDIYGKIANEIPTIDDATNLINASMFQPMHHSYIGKRPFFEKVVEKNKDLYVKYINDFIKGYFDSGHFEKKYNDITAKLKPYIENDATAFYSVQEIENAQGLLKEFIDLRVMSVKGQLAGSVIDDNYSTYIDASHINLEEMGHQKGGYVHVKGEEK